MNLQQTLVSHISWVALRALRPLMLVTVVTILMAAGAYFVMLRPVEQHLASVRLAYDRARSTQSILVTSRRLQERLRLASQRLGEVQQALPTQGDFTGLAVAISELARAERVTLPGMTHAREKAEAGLPVKASLSFHATGEYPAIYRFLHRLESSPSYLVVESMDVRRNPSDKSGSSVINVTITVTTFLRADESTPKVTS